MLLITKQKFENTKFEKFRIRSHMWKIVAERLCVTRGLCSLATFKTNGLHIYQNKIISYTNIRNRKSWGTTNNHHWSCVLFTFIVLIFSICTYKSFGGVTHLAMLWMREMRPVWLHLDLVLLANRKTTKQRVKLIAISLASSKVFHIPGGCADLFNNFLHVAAVLINRPPAISPQSWTQLFY